MSPPPTRFYKVSREDWSLHRKGEIDRQRHREKAREAIKKNLADVVSEERLMSFISHRQRKHRIGGMS